ncbi:global transcription factor group E4 [Striga asiatica]|uniref:Global transcription factor group E4 n=1 Tax=Striga asiatica TaxID=4170 RepID=A0A5A7R094_STRAF|nr:global transcription factor group E4 [Striga asiatica]
MKWEVTKERGLNLHKEQIAREEAPSNISITCSEFEPELGNQRRHLTNPGHLTYPDLQQKSPEKIDNILQSSKKTTTAVTPQKEKSPVDAPAVMPQGTLDPHIGVNQDRLAISSGPRSESRGPKTGNFDSPINFGSYAPAPEVTSLKKTNPAATPLLLTGQRPPSPTQTLYRDHVLGLEAVANPELRCNNLGQQTSHSIGPIVQTAQPTAPLNQFQPHSFGPSDPSPPHLSPSLGLPIFGPTKPINYQAQTNPANTPLTILNSNPLQTIQPILEYTRPSAALCICISECVYTKEDKRGRMKRRVVIETMAICPIGGGNLLRWLPQARGGGAPPAWRPFHSTSQRFSSIPIAIPQLAEAAPYVVNRRPPAAPLHCRVELKTARHTVIRLDC